MDNKINKNVSFLSIYKLDAQDYIACPDGKTTVDSMIIGFFDSLDKCKEVEKEYKILPGFSKPSCKFKTTKFEFPNEAATDVQQVYYVQEWLFCELTGEEQVTEIGLFLSKEAAEAAKEKYNGQVPSKTSSYSSTIYIDKYPINQKNWQEGFDSYTWFQYEKHLT